MPESRSVADEDRLPWLEPYRDRPRPKAPPPPPPQRRPNALLAGMLVVIAAGGAGFWLGQREEARPLASDVVEVAPAKPQPVPKMVQREQPTVQAELVASPPAAEAPTTKFAEAPVKKAAKRATTSRKRIRTAGVESTRLKAVRAAQERPAARTSRNRARWPKMPSPGPAGQVIQLGAFSQPARAQAAYRTRVARYPLLGRMPRVIVPVITKPSGRVLYVLRLGTTSRQQSKTVCRNLRRSGDHCLVIG